MLKLVHIVQIENDKVMNDKIILTCLILALFGWIFLCRNDFRNWQELNSRDKFNIIRVPFIIVVGIILLTLKIIKDY